ncbi:MAG: hypothetical protein RIQ56_757 [Candidatus Parcubacteria bacterium]|jgi:D-3-phosphoglycerate dehydrogenase
MAIVFFDFDSTVVSKETLDHAIAQVLHSHPESTRMISEIEEITKLGMEGKLDFRESVKRRLATVPLSRTLLQETGEAMLHEITSDMQEVFSWLRNNGHEVNIVSGGFGECIGPVAKKLGVADKNVYTNSFVFSLEGIVVGVDETALLWTNEGKTPVLKKVRAEHPAQKIVMIGDGANDLKAWESGAADIFIGFGAHAVRETVQRRAKHFVHSGKELLAVLQKVL